LLKTVLDAENRKILVRSYLGGDAQPHPSPLKLFTVGIFDTFASGCAIEEVRERTIDILGQ